MSADFKEALTLPPENKIKSGKLIIISGMSGSGKSMIANLLAKSFNYALIKKYVTRPFRKAEIEAEIRGENVGIRSVLGLYNNGEEGLEQQEKFNEDRIKRFKALRPQITYTNYNNFYGFSTTEIDNYLDQGRNAVIIVTDPGAIKDLKRIYAGKCLSCYIHRAIPKNKDIFIEIAKLREDTPDSAETRYRQAQREWNLYINNIELYDYTILNTESGTDRLKNVIKELDANGWENKDKKMEQREKSKTTKPKIYLLCGSPGSGKDDILEIIRTECFFHSIILPKHTTRDRRENDGEEMICPGDAGFNMQSCDVQYQNFGTTYGINTREIRERLEDGISSSIVVSNESALKYLQGMFPNEVVTIYIQGLSKEEYIIQERKNSNDEYVQKRIAQYDNANSFYYTNWLFFDHIIINNGDLKDLKLQIHNILEYYDKERSLNGYADKANKYIARFARVASSKESK